ncbi:MAG: M1 family metallopeptidase [Bacteroidia bacterium]
MKNIIFILLLVAFTNVQAQKLPDLKTLPYDSASVPREHPVDFINLRLEASFVPKEGLIKGSVLHTFKSIRSQVDSVYLDAPGIDIQEVFQKGEKINFQIYPEGLTIYLKSSLRYGEMSSFTINYEAHPRAGLYFIGWNDETNRSRKQIWSQGQGIDNRNWIPMYDEMNDKVTSEMIITMPKPFKVLSNGVLEGITDKGDSQVWHYKMSHPHAPYLIMLGIGEYEIETRTTQSGLKTHLWYYPDWKDKVASTYAYSTEMIDFFEKEIGVPFPWENYSQIPVQDFMYGAMENTTATVFGDFFLTDKRMALDRSYVGVNAHELAHQWFGDMITARSKAHHWLQESFATHYNTLYESEVYGQDFKEQAFRNAQNASLNASTRDLYPLASSDAGSTRWYPKGSSVLFMLRYVIGDECFRAGIKHYLEQNAYANVDSDDLLDAFEEACGYSLNWFWNEWVYRGGEPVWKVEASSAEGKTTFTLNQLQMNVPYVSTFKMPVILEVHFEDGSTVRDSVWVENESEEFSLTYPASKKVAYTLFDPGNRVMKFLEFEKEFNQLKVQATSAKHMIDRLDAVLGMEKIDLDIKRSTLQKIASSNEYYSVRAEAIDQLKDDKKSRKLLSQLVDDKEVRVRKSLVSSYDTLPEWLISSVEKLLLDSSYALQEEVLSKLSAANPSKRSAYLKITANEMGNNSFNTRITWLGIAIENGEQKYQEELIDYLSPAFEFGTRRNVVLELLKLKIFSEKAMLYAWDAAQNPNSRLSSAGRGYLSRSMKANEENKEMVLAFLQNQKTKAEAWKLEIINKVVSE